MTLRSQLFRGILLTGVLLVAGCRKPTPPQDKAPPVVTVRTPKREMVLDYLELSGTVAASRTVDLVARVTGYLETVDFNDGAYVDKGQLLFTIEPKLYEQQLALSQAQLDQSQSEYDRQIGLIKENATSVANVEKWRSQRDQAAAQVELARLNLSYTKVTAPFAGRIGRRLIDSGNLVGAGGVTKLATLDKVLPIYVYFNLNERAALRVRSLLAQQGVDPFSRVGNAPVHIALQGEEGFPHEGVLDFADISVSTSTGTIQLRAVFENKDHALFPGLFARVRIPMGDPSAMWVIPSNAISNDQQGDYVLIVGSDNVVQRKNVQTGPSTPDGRAIRTGLSAKDRVIVKGLQEARPGAAVSVSSMAVQTDEP